MGLVDGWISTHIFLSFDHIHPYLVFHMLPDNSKKENPIVEKRKKGGPMGCSLVIPPPKKNPINHGALRKTTPCKKKPN